MVPSTDKNEIQDLRDVIAVEQEEKNDMHRKLQSAENECKFKLNWLADFFFFKKRKGFCKLHRHHEPIQTGKHDYKLVFMDMSFSLQQGNMDLEPFA